MDVNIPPASIMGNSKPDRAPKKLSKITDHYDKLRAGKRRNLSSEPRSATTGTENGQPGKDSEIVTEVTNKAGINKTVKNSTGYCFICKQSFAYEDGYHFFLFPWKNPDLLQKWFKSLGLEGKPQSLQPTYYSRICSQHFPDSAIRSCGKVIRLQDTAVPQLLPGNNQPETISQPQPVSGNLLIIINPMPAIPIAPPQLIPYSPTANGVIYRAIKPKETTNPVFPAVVESCQALRDDVTVKAENMEFPEDNMHGEFIDVAVARGTETSEETSINPDVVIKSEPVDPVPDEEFFNVSGTIDTANIPVKDEYVDSEVTGEPAGEIGNWDPLETCDSDSRDEDCLDTGDTSELDNSQPPTNDTKPSKIKRNRLYPASCTPNDADSPAVMKKKLTILYKAYHDLKRRKKTALQAALRLRKENAALKKQLETYQPDL